MSSARGRALQRGELHRLLDHVLVVGQPAGLDRAGGDGVDADLGGERLRQALGQRDDRPLARRVGDRAPRARHARHRGDVHDVPLPRLQVGHRGAAGEEGPLQVHVEDLVPDRLGQAFEVVVGDEVGRRGVVDQHVEPAELLGRSLDHRAHRRVVGDVGRR